MLYRAFKVKIYPTHFQEQYLKLCFYTRTYVYNWFVEKKEDYFRENKKTIGFSFLHKEFMKYRNDIPWIYEVNSRIYRFAENDCSYAYKSYFKQLTEKPKIQSFDKKHFSLDRCLIIDNKTFYIAGGNEPKKKERHGFHIKTSEDISFLKNEDIVKVTITFDNLNYYASFDYKCHPTNYDKHKYDIVGIDWGLKTFATQSDGKSFHFKKDEMIKLEHKCSYLKSVLDKKEKNSKNYQKIKRKLNKCFKRITHIRRDFIDKYTTWLCKTYKTIKIEDLDILKMAKNHKLAKAIYRGGFGIFKNMLKSKSEIYNNNLILVDDRKFASSKICSNCGCKKQKLALSERTYKCENCGLEIDRDLNAAINIEHY